MLRHSVSTKGGILPLILNMNMIECEDFSIARCSPLNVKAIAPKLNTPLKAILLYVNSNQTYYGKDVPNQIDAQRDFYISTPLNSTSYMPESFN